MRTREAFGAVLILASASTSSAQWTSDTALQRFNDQIARYMTVRHDAEARVGVPVVSSDPAAILRSEAALANAIRKARLDARPGDIFNETIATEFRRSMRRVLDKYHVSDADLFAASGSDSPRDGTRPGVNRAFDWRLGATMPAVLIDVLPKVPWPLEYRVVAGDLILLDVEAQLIVDVLPDALAGTR